jgi:hypothetical protein
MVELETPELTDNQIEELCLIAEKTARQYVLSKVTSKNIESLDISAEAEDTKLLMLEIEVVVTLSPLMNGYNMQKLVDEAVREAFSSVEKYLRGLACRSQK